MKISASILAADFAKLGEELTRTEQSGADMLHFDVMDGVFVPNISFGLPVLHSIRSHTNLYFDTHLMITDPLRYIDAFADAGADGITVHLESQSDPAACLKAIHAKGKQAGLSIRPKTPVEALFPYLHETDLVLVMTVEPGFGGQSFMPDMLSKITELRQYAAREKLSFDIEVDGGINPATAGLCVAAGANVLVAGSNLYGAADMGQAVAALRACGG